MISKGTSWAGPRNLMTVSSSSSGIIMDREINAPGHVNNVVGGINEMDKGSLK